MGRQWCDELGGKSFTNLSWWRWLNYRHSIYIRTVSSWLLFSFGTFNSSQWQRQCAAKPPVIWWSHLPKILGGVSVALSKPDSPKISSVKQTTGSRSLLSEHIYCDFASLSPDLPSACIIVIEVNFFAYLFSYPYLDWLLEIRMEGGGEGAR